MVTCALYIKRLCAMLANIISSMRIDKTKRIEIKAHRRGSYLGQGVLNSPITGQWFGLDTHECGHSAEEKRGRTSVPCVLVALHFIVPHENSFGLRT